MKAVTNLVTEIRKLADLKPNGVWRNIVNSFEEDLAPLPIRHAKAMPTTSLFTATKQVRYQFSNEHVQPVKLQPEDHDFELIANW